MAELLQEFCDSKGITLRVDRQGAVIRGIKILGPQSRNGREYLPEALATAVGLYEGAKVNVNHPKGHPLAPRDYQERIGVIRNVQHRTGAGLFADFHFNPKHYLSEQLLWDATHAPENVGFSHNVQARASRRGDTMLVEEIVRVHSVDLVADPATTRGLFEAKEPVPSVENAEVARATETTHTSNEESTPRSDSSCAADETTLREQQADLLEKLCHEQAREIERLRIELDQLRAKQAVEQRRVMVRSLLAEYHLPDPAHSDAPSKAIVSEDFMQALVSAADEPAMRRLLEERCRLIGGAKAWNGRAHRSPARPASRDQADLDPRPVLDGKAFARAITG